MAAKIIATANDARTPDSTMQIAVENRSDDGNATTANAGVDLQRNLELAADATRKQLGELVLQAVRAHDKFATTAIPAKYSLPRFSRYDAGK